MFVNLQRSPLHYFMNRAHSAANTKREVGGLVRINDNWLKRAYF
jgi:hypothetical protein